MKQNTKTVTKKATTASEALIKQLNNDVRDSVLVVSLLVNAYILVAWLVIEVSSRYDAALINYIRNN